MPGKSLMQILMEKVLAHPAKFEEVSGTAQAETGTAKTEEEQKAADLKAQQEAADKQKKTKAENWAAVNGEIGE